MEKGLRWDEWGLDYVNSIAWSPNDRLVVMGDESLTVWDRDTTEPSPTILLEKTVDIQNHHASWTSDGTTIGFATNREGTFDIFTILPDGTSLERITFDDTANEDYPDWSPDGVGLAYLQSDAEADEPEYRFVLREWIGENTYNVTPPAPIWEYYKWLPDNTGLIFYMQVEEDRYALHWLDIDCLTSAIGCTETAFHRIPNTETTQYLGFDVTAHMNLQFEEEN